MSEPDCRSQYSSFVKDVLNNTKPLENLNRIKADLPPTGGSRGKEYMDSKSMVKDSPVKSKETIEQDRDLRKFSQIQVEGLKGGANSR